MAKELPREVADHIRGQAAAPAADDRLAAIRQAATLMRDYEEEVADLTMRLEAKTAELNLMRTKLLPEMMEEAAVSKLAVEAEGNHPGFEVRIRPKYIASIPKDMEAEKREDAFAYLTELGGGPMIRTTVSFEFPRDSEDQLASFLAMLEHVSYTTMGGEEIPRPRIEQTIHHATYSSWLREEWELSAKAGRPMPDLSRLNAMVLRLAELKFEKEKK